MPSVRQKVQREGPRKAPEGMQDSLWNEAIGVRQQASKAGWQSAYFVAVERNTANKQRAS